MKLAQQENRMISRTEGQIRKNVGYAMLAIVTVVLVANPKSRKAYGVISAVFNSAIGIWMTGRISL